ncbi:MAG: glycoside hydrolase family 140 protein [Bacteroidota bacterium]
MKKACIISFSSLLLLLNVNSQPLKVSENGRHLQNMDGTSFFWMGDTGWELFHRLDREEVKLYFADRAEKGFNLIQAVILHELQAFEAPNAYGDFPLEDENIEKINTTPGDNPDNPEEYDYWDHVEYIVAEAEKYDLIMGVLPCWGEYVTPRFRERTIQTEEQGYNYGYYVGNRLKKYNDNIVWILGGDRLPDESKNGVNIWRAMAEGITDGVNDNRGYDSKADYSSTFMTYHCYASSARWFHEDPWLDMHTWGSYHEKRNNERSYRTAYQDWILPDPKPSLNSEPCYEDLPVNYDWKDVSKGRFDAFDIRQAAYWSVMSGTCGHTYGNHYVWQMYKEENPHPPLTLNNRMEWHEALDSPGAFQMQYLKDLILSRFSIHREPNQAILSRNPYDPAGNLVACSSPHTTMIYNPTGKTVSIEEKELEKLYPSVKAWWYNARNGEAILIGTFTAGEDKLDFTPPGEVERGNDWVLVLDDVKADLRFTLMEPGEIKAN